MLILTFEQVSQTCSVPFFFPPLPENDVSSGRLPSVPAEMEEERRRGIDSGAETAVKLCIAEEPWEGGEEERDKVASERAEACKDVRL